MTLGRSCHAEFGEGAHRANGGHMRNRQRQAMITPMSEGAEGRCYPLLFRTPDGPAAIQTSGVLTDRLVRTVDRDRLAVRAADSPTGRAAQR